MEVKGFTLMVAGIMRGSEGVPLMVAGIMRGSEGVHSNGGRYNEGK